MSISTADAGLHYAGSKKRIIGFLFDFLVIAGYILVLLVFGFGIVSLAGQSSLLASPVATNILAEVVLVIPAILYFALQESAQQQATWGKRRAGIKVTTVDGARMSFGRSLLRSFLKFFPWQLAHVCVIYLWSGNESVAFLIGALVAQGLVIIYVAGMFFNKKHRTLYDLIAGTSVVVSE